MQFNSDKDKSKYKTIRTKVSHFVILLIKVGNSEREKIEGGRPDGELLIEVV